MMETFGKLFETYEQMPMPTVAVVHGAAIGGANGLLAACDLAYSTDDTVFSLSEVKIGIVPACIGPYIIKPKPAVYEKHMPAHLACQRSACFL